MPVISFINPKGGCGKSTTAIHLARALSLSGQSVLLVDADPQGSLINWSEAAIEPLLDVGIASNSNELIQGIKQYKKQFDWIIVDSAGRLEDMSAAAINVANLIIIPIQPSALDAWAVKPLIKAVKESSKHAFFQITRAKPKTIISFQISAILAGYDIEILTGAIHDRTGFTVSIGQGTTLLDTDPNSMGAEEIYRMTKQVQRSLQHEQ